MSDGSAESSSREAVATDRNSRPVEDRRGWLSVARKDVSDAGRSWQLYVLTAVFTTAMAFGGAGPILSAMTFGGTNSNYAATDGLVGMAGFIEFLVPLVVLLLGHMAIAGQLERGSLRTLLALPLSRRDVVGGILLGRTVVAVTTLAVGLSVAAVPLWVLYDGLDLLVYAEFSAAILAFAACFAALAVGISAASPTRGHALAGAVGAFGLTTFLWDFLLFLVRFATGVEVVLVNGDPNWAPGWYVFLDRVHPGTALRHVVSTWVVPVFPCRGVGASSKHPCLTTQGPEPFYLDAPVLALVLVAWGLVPLAVGYWRFRDAEIV